MQVSSASGAQALEQMKQARERMFSRADQDGSGGLGLDEFRSAGPGKSGGASATSAGGAAATDRAAEIFARLDADGDGSVTASEMEAGRPPGPPPGGAFSSEAMSALLSGQEAPGSTLAGGDAGGLFASLDTDGDGSLSATEFQAAQGMRGPHGPGGPPPGGPPPDGPPPGGSPGEDDGGIDLTSLLASLSDEVDDSRASDGASQAGASQADALAALVKKALETYLSASATSSAAGTVVSA